MAVSGHGNLDSIHDFLSIHANPSLKSNAGWTALDFAQNQNRYDAVSYLKEILQRQEKFTNSGLYFGVFLMD